MSDLNLPPSGEEQPPRHLQFPRDMVVNGDSSSSSWLVNHTTEMVWLWLRWPLLCMAQPFKPEHAMQLAEQLAAAAVAATELQSNVTKLLEVRAGLLDANGQPITDGKRKRSR